MEDIASEKISKIQDSRKELKKNYVIPLVRALAAEIGGGVGDLAS